MSKRIMKSAFYLIGIIVVVIIAASIWFQMNNWKENRMQMKNMYELSSSLNTALLDNNDILNNLIQQNNNTLKSIKILLDHFSQNLPYHDSLSTHFNVAMSRTPMVIDESIIENALDTDNPFLGDISQLGSTYVQKVKAFNTAESLEIMPFINTVITPFKISNFTVSDAGNSAVPKSYESLKTNPEFSNMLNQVKTGCEKSNALGREITTLTEELNTRTEEFRNTY